MSMGLGRAEERPDTIAKITRRLLPFVGIIYLIAYIDRQNVGYAKLQMVGDLGISEYAYGLGASLLRFVAVDAFLTWGFLVLVSPFLNKIWGEASMIRR